MRCSELFYPTLKENPADAEVVSHRLLLRGGFIRKLTAGVYSYLPLGLKVLRKIETIVREEMDRAGAQEVLLPAVQPADLWQESGRWDKYGPELLRFSDRHGRDSCLGPTHEEVMTDLVRGEIRSYRDLPKNLYQIQTKFRDEIRPRFGLMRGREFIMKDGYSFAATDADADAEYRKMRKAYTRIFQRLGLTFRMVDADSGSIGGSFSHEFMVLADTGEDTLACCTACDFAANVEKAPVKAPRPAAQPASEPLKKIATPGQKSVDEVCGFLGISAAELIKTTVWMAGDKPVVALVRGDRDVQPVKLANLCGVDEVRMATDTEIHAAGLGVPGFLGPVGCAIDLVADSEVMAMARGVSGAGEEGYHFQNIVPGRDVTPTVTGDIRTITEQDPCPACGKTLQLKKGIEVGHIFKLGTVYSEPLKANFLDANGKEQPMVMGCYGIGVSRIMAAAIEQNNDKDGIIFPLALAPYQVIILNLSPKDQAVTEAAEMVYNSLTTDTRRPLEALVDDRAIRPGGKFKDADLIGVPFRVTVGKKLATDGVVEVRRRRDGYSVDVPVAEAASLLQRLVDEEKSTISVF